MLMGVIGLGWWSYTLGLRVGALEAQLRDIDRALAANEAQLDSSRARIDSLLAALDTAQAHAPVHYPVDYSGWPAESLAARLDSMAREWLEAEDAPVIRGYWPEVVR